MPLNCGACNVANPCTAVSTFCSTIGADPVGHCDSCSTITLSTRTACLTPADCATSEVCDPGSKRCLPSACETCGALTACPTGERCNRPVENGSDNGFCAPCPSAAAATPSVLSECRLDNGQCGAGETCDHTVNLCMPTTCPGTLCNATTTCIGSSFCEHVLPTNDYGFCRTCPAAGGPSSSQLVSCQGLDGHCWAGEACGTSANLCEPVACPQSECSTTTACPHGTYCERSSATTGKCVACLDGPPSLAVLPACDGVTATCFVGEACTGGNGVCLPSTCGAMGDAGADAAVDAAKPDASDSGTDARSDSAIDATGSDAGTVDASTDAYDAGAIDAGYDATLGDAGTDSGVDSSVDSGFDAGTDSGVDAGVDSGGDAAAGPLTSGSYQAQNLMLAAGSLFWRDTQHVYSVPAAGGQVTTVASDGELNNYTTDGTNVYWWSLLSQNLFRAPLSNSASVSTIASGQPPHSFPDPMAVDGTSVYWVANTSSGGGTLRRVAIGGGGVVDMIQPVTINASAADHMTVSGANVFVGDRGDHYINRCPTNAVSPNSSCTILSTSDGPAALHADIASNMFWLGFPSSLGVVKEIPTGTTTSSTVLPGQSGNFYDFALGGGMLFYGTDQVYEVPAPNPDGGVTPPGSDGGAPVPVAAVTSGYVATDLAADDSFVYWLEYDQVNTRFAIRRAAK